MVKKDELSQLDIMEEEQGTSGKGKKKLPKWLIFPILGVVLLFLVLLSFLGGNSQKDSGSAVEVVTVKSGEVKETFDTSGTVVSDKQKVFYSPVNAPISDSKLEVGKTVKKGDLLVSFDVKDLEKANQESQLQGLQTTYSNQSTLEQAAKSANEVAKQNAEVEQQKQSLRNKIADLRNQINNANNAIESSQPNRDKLNELKKKLQDNLKQIETLKVTEKHGAEPDATEAANEIARLTNENMDLQNSITLLEAQIPSGDGSAALYSELSAAEQSLADLEAKAPAEVNGLTGGELGGMQVSENLAELASLSTEELLQKGREGIKAEFDGVIAKVDIEGTNMATQGSPLFTLVDNQSVGVELEVSANDFDKLVIGNKAVVTVGKHQYEGEVVKVNKIATTNEKGVSSIGAKLKIKNPDGELFIGVTAKVSVTVDDVKSALYIPSEVVNESKSGSYVYIIEEGTIKKQTVETGINSGSRIEIKKGLAEGDSVVYDTTDVKEGMSATAVEKDQ
ncbi:efflux RND transporter periplasmic adaptor subunit [Ohessyouella blattaphilus]|uniref:Efflux RND transporter periplasmic adaptor subunit n=1 Tax=Ohessyouella blattaphilus TaxID=2949333 RepID=A0ABT1EGS6_9FIRM|nr:efflux RND transporter periplasmic adaptor subunit [Ohessyouella blattaphilus]MCP1109910.1 efflux RND transporter periplasmic adaptor subunit [Ohessyouella blattaphilus]MCR8563304.1 efflux RND transporter periplasmic adaptor subunit [Ohessyouella blattaphilus]